MSFVLYNAPQSTCSQKARLVLHEKNLEFSEVKLDLFKGDQLTAEYKAINPNGVVPSLIHGDDVITDSSVIIEYLDDAFPGHPLSPSDPVGRAHMREWMRFFEEVSSPAIRIPSYNRVFLRLFQSMTDEEFHAFGESKPLRKDFFLKMGKTGYSDKEVRQSEDRLHMTVERMETQLAKTGDCLVGAFGLADVCVLPTFVRMADIGMGHLWQDCPDVTRWFRSLQARPTYQAAFYQGSLLSEQYGITA